MSFCIARAVKLSRTSAVFLVGKCHRMLGTRRLCPVYYGFSAEAPDGWLRFLSRHGNAFGFYGAIILATDLWTSEVRRS